MILAEAIEYVVTEANAYFEASATFLIGSYARGDATEVSDVDILVVTSSTKSLNIFYQNLQCDFDKKLISIIRYPFHIFQKHWLGGSLFTYHLVYEAKLYYADSILTNFMKSEFRLKASFSDDIASQGEILALYEPTDLFDDSAVYFSSQLFLVIKNIAIFSLAEQQKITLNKWQAYSWISEQWHQRFGPSLHFEAIKSAYLHIYKKENLSKLISKDDFKMLVSFTGEVLSNVQDF
jgi:predicted nucleotidyltransferase